MKRIAIFISALLLAGLIWGGLVYVNSKQIAIDVVKDGAADTRIQNQEVSDKNQVEVIEVKPSVTEKIAGIFSNTVGEIKDSLIKPTVLWPVQFAPQAPLLNWDALHQEACEEASMIMVDYYYDKKKLDNNIMEDEIQEAVKWQTDNGYKVDVTADETKDILKVKYGLDSELLYNPTIDQIKEDLADGRLVIVPAAGRQLGNPYFRAPGPRYHMFVIIGYDDKQKEFIVNDPGTKRGEKYRYSYDVLMNAMHDWNDGEVESGQKVVVILK